MIGQNQQLQRLMFIAVVLVVLILGSKALRIYKQEDTSKQITISQTMSDKMWVNVQGVVMPDIVSMGFDKTGQYGAVISSDGFLMKSKDGGNSWFEANKVPLEDGDIPNAVSIRSDGSAVVAIGVDESAYTAIYEEKDNGNWKQTKCLDCGGIFAGSSDATVFAGGNGLIVNEKGSSWEFSHLPDWGQTTLYTVAKSKSDGSLLVVGESNLVAIAEKAKGWRVISPPTNSALPFYAGDINNQIALIGGVNGSLWKFDINANDWRPIKGLKDKLTVLSILITDKEAIVSGGELSGKNGFIIGTEIATEKNNNIWKYNLLPKSTAKIVSLIATNSSILAATSDGHILKRTKNSLGL